MQLVYRAASYTYQPAAPALSPTAIATLQTLLDRGQGYHPRQPTPNSYTLNWRFQAVCNPRNANLQTAQA